MLSSARIHTGRLDEADYHVAIPLALNFIASGECVNSYVCMA